MAIVAHSAGTLVGKEMYFMRPARVWAFVNVDSRVVGGRSDGNELPNHHCSPHVQALHRKSDSRLVQLEGSRIRGLSFRDQCGTFDPLLPAEETHSGGRDPKCQPGLPTRAD